MGDGGVCGTPCADFSRPAEELEYTCLLTSTFTEASHDRVFKTWQTPATYPECLFWKNVSVGGGLRRMPHGPQYFESNNWQGRLSQSVQNHNQHHVARIEPVFWQCRPQYAPRCNVTRSPCLQQRMHRKNAT